MIQLSIENFYQLNVSTTVTAHSYAFYLYKGGEIMEKTKYSALPVTSFNLQHPGMYRVKVYKKSLDGKTESALSASLRFDGFRDIIPSPDRKDVAIVGISRTAAFAAHVFETKHNVLYFIDPSGLHVGKSFFGREIRAAGSDGHKVRLIGHEMHRNEFPTLEAFCFTTGIEDALTRELHKHGAMDLYRISRRTYLAGLLKGSLYIQEFIYAKYNCRIPLNAIIGEGTRLGYGGIGVVIHSEAVIGKNCVIAQNVTLGSRAGGGGPPIIGDNVWISPGSKCLGGRIGNNVIIGANAVVLKEVADNCAVAGVPAKVISTDMNRYSNYFKK